MNSSVTDELLLMPPFGSESAEKNIIFKKAMGESLQYHYHACDILKRLCDKRKFDPFAEVEKIEDIIYLPVQLFKIMRISSVAENASTKTLFSSSTSYGIPSRIVVDSETIRRQRQALISVMNSFIGNERLPFVVFDLDPRTGVPSAEISGRSSAIRGFLLSSNRVEYVMSSDERGDLELQIQKLVSVLKEVGSSKKPFCIFGFTYIIYHFVKQLLEENISFSLPNAALIHIGGWKKLYDKSVSKDKFNETMLKVFGLSKNRITDVYGFTEQIGMVYPDCEFGLKHAPIFAEVIVRDPQSLQSARDGEEGLLQFLFPIPTSYPGISVVTDDVGKITSRGRCRCGRFGTTFVITGRAKNVEPRGCGDILAERTNLA